MREGGPFFWDHNINDVFQHQLEGLRKETEAMADDKVRSTPRESLVADLFEQFRLDAPVLREQDIYTTKEDAQVDVSQDIRRMIRDRSRPLHIQGTTFRLHVPFVGDKQFFRIQPSSYSLNPQTGLISEGEIVSTYTAVDPKADEVKGLFDSWLEAIRHNLRTLNGNCQSFNTSLPNEIEQVLGKRYLRLQKDEEVLAGLGYPTKKPTPPISATSKASTRGKEHQYDAFICHASEDKESIVRPLAAKLQELGFETWYDEFELTIGDSLRQSIDRGLVKSRYGIVILSTSFMGKDWTQYELNGLLAKEIGTRKVILPIWHGISRNEVLAYSPSLADKVALDSNMGLDQLVVRIAPVLAKAP